MKKSMVLVAVVAMMMSCSVNGSSKSDKVETGASNVEVGVEAPVSCSSIQGVYKGTLPAASSPGIRMVLTLNEDKTFQSDSEFLEEEDGSFTEKGTYCLSENILTATSEDGTVSFFKVETNRLRMLDREKKEIFGELADKYLLDKVN